MAAGSSLVSRPAAVSDVRVGKTTKNFEFAMAHSDGTTTSQMIRCVAQKACPEVCEEWPVNCGPEDLWMAQTRRFSSRSVSIGRRGKVRCEPFLVRDAWSRRGGCDGRETHRCPLALVECIEVSIFELDVSFCLWAAGLAQNDSR